MKKLFLFSIALFVCCFCLYIPQPAFADVVTFTQNNYSVYEMNSSLYNALCSLASTIKGESVTSFSSSYFSPITREYAIGASDSEQSTLIVNDLDSGLFDITTGEQAKYDCLKTCSEITSLGGLSYMNMRGVTRVVVDNNAISSVRAEDLTSFINVKEISINNNSLSSFETSSYFANKIDYLSLKNNRLISANINCLAQNAVCDLSQNNLSSIEDIVCVSKNLSSVNLAFNNLHELDSQTLLSKFGCNPTLLLQGVESSYQFMDKISVQSQGSCNIKAHIRYSTRSLYYTGDDDICATSGDSTLETLLVPAGKIEIYYTYDSLPAGITGDMLPLTSCDINPPQAVYTIQVGKKTSNELVQKNDFTISFALPTYTLANQNDFTIYATLSTIQVGKDNDSLLDNTFNVKNNGNYTFESQINFDGLKSQKLSISVTKHNTAGIYVGISLVLVVVLGTLAFFVLRNWLKNGGRVAPLSAKQMSSVSSSNKNQDLSSSTDISQEVVDIGLDSQDKK